MIKRRLKYQYILLSLGILFVLPLLILATFVKTNLNDTVEEITDYVSEEVIDNSLPVVNTEIRVIAPYVNPNVTIAKTYYDYKADEESQLKSILLHDNTYMQSTGIDYVHTEPFEVIAILDGTVAAIKEDPTTGKAIEIRHENGVVSIYESLSDIKVQKGDIVYQGQLLGISGSNELEKDLGNHLHFEIYTNGQSVNPENYLNKELSSIEEK